MHTARLARHRHWVFDLDGTLTVAVHDFAAMRAELRLAPGEPILESLAALPPGDARAAYARLDRLELRFAALARPQPGAGPLLAALHGRGADLGIVTRNSVAVARETLRRCALDAFFPPENVIGRESAPPKPRPDGVAALLGRWGAHPADAVVVGDYLFDLEAGREAGTTTVYFDPADTGRWSAHADLRVRGHDELGALAGEPEPQPDPPRGRERFSGPLATDEGR